MILLGKYEEFSPNMGFQSITESLDTEPYDGKKEILEYLRKGNIHMVTATRIKDIFTDKQTNEKLVYMDDGKYSWTSRVIYYVDKYNLRLPNDFEQHVLGQ